MKIGITCSTGKLGRRIYRETVKVAGIDNVFPIGRNPEKAKELGLLNFIKADFNEPSDLEAAFKEIDVLCFITSMDPSIEKRTIQNHNVVEAAKRMKGQGSLKKIVLAGFIGIPSYLAEMMNALDKEILESGITYTLCKNGYYIEPDIRDAKKHISEGKITNSAADGKLAFTTRDEIAFAYGRILTEKTNKYDNKSIYVHGKAMTQQEFVDLVNKIYGADLKYESVTIEEYEKLLTERYSEMPFIAKIVTTIYAEIRAGRMAGDESQFEQITGRKHIDWETYITANKDNENVNE